MRKVTLLALAGFMALSLTACSQKPAELPKTSDEPKTTDVNTEADVIVLGAGGAGMAAAITAKENGASVLVLEKMPMVGGGNTLISGAEMAAPGNWLQEKEGIEDSVDLFYEDIMKGGDNIADPEVVRVLAENALSAAEWLRDDVHVQFEDNMLFFGGHSVKRSLVPLNASGVEPIQKLKAKCDELGIEIQTDTPATKLIQDEAGKVLGVEAQHDGQTLTYTAHNGVIIATGGFGSNLEMRKQYNPMMASKRSMTARL